MAYVENASSYNKETSIIDNPKVLKDIIKISGCTFRFVPRPDEHVPEVEVPTFEYLYNENLYFILLSLFIG